MAFREYGSYLSASRALESGEVDAFIADGSILSGFSDEGRVLLSDQLSVQEYGVGRSNLMTEYDQMYQAKLRNTVYYLGGVNAEVIDDAFVRSVAEPFNITSPNGATKRFYGIQIAPGRTFTLSNDPQGQSYEFWEILADYRDTVTQDMSIDDEGNENQYLGVAFYYYTVQGPDGAAGDGRAQPR